MKGVEIVMFEQDGSVLFEQELRDLKNRGGACSKDAAAIASSLDMWEQRGFRASTTFNFRPIEGKPYEPNLHEARLLKTSRSDGVHGYRIFYVQTRRPSTDKQVVVLLMLWAKDGGNRTPKAVLDKAWERARAALGMIREKRFFCKPDGDGSH